MFLFEIPLCVFSRQFLCGGREAQVFFYFIFSSQVNKPSVQVKSGAGRQHEMILVIVVLVIVKSASVHGFSILNLCFFVS